MDRYLFVHIGNALVEPIICIINIVPFLMYSMMNS